MGKTSLALDIARNAAVRHGVPVGIFSLEMSSEQLIDRMLAAESHVNAWKIRTGAVHAKKISAKSATRSRPFQGAHLYRRQAGQ
jgi:replicative DNA helicase